MNPPSRIVTPERREVKLRIWRFGYSFLSFLVVTLAMGIFVVLVMSGSACTWNLHVRCFSVSRDTVGVILSAAEDWGALAIAVALVSATIQMYRALTWWSAFIVVPVSVLAVSLLPIGAASLAKEAISGPFFFLAVGTVLFAAYQFSLLICSLLGKSE
jgi:hypothetical protein